MLTRSIALVTLFKDINVKLMARSNILHQQYIYKYTTSYSGYHTHSKIYKTFLNLRVRKLLHVPGKNTGHNNQGRYTVKSCGRCTKTLHVRDAGTYNSLTYMAMLFGTVRAGRTLKLHAVTVGGDGTVQYVPCTTRYRPFMFVIGRVLNNLTPLYGTRIPGLLQYANALYAIKTATNVCYVANTNYHRPAIARATGTHCIVFNKPILVALGIVKLQLPSGKIKLIPNSITALLGAVSPRMASEYSNTLGGFCRNMGVKPRVRGVVKNPVDHPHGGRVRTVAHPRTPWGFPTK
eukprot:TRINITY_DN0_c15_g1_i1.p1 TRINITY_DN0_c15_g1~~TRINITY_DN0_c15_g1_i1.p1  ORF type:complete len:292 (-),score=-116.56 TRINITY_DN0_c15_g1_i1:580-1455(-)